MCWTCDILRSYVECLWFMQCCWVTQARVDIFFTMTFVCETFEVVFALCSLCV